MMFDEAKVVLEKIAVLVVAVEGDSNDAEIGAAQELRHTALALVRKIAARDIAVAEMLDDFDRRADQL